MPGRFLRPVLPVIHGITHYRTTEYSIEEQINLNSEVFLTLQRFHFLAGLAEREGELPTTLAPVTIAHLDAGLFVDKAKTTRLRAKLTARDGTPEEAVHREIAARRDRCVCLARPAFHDLVHRSHAPWDGTAPGVHPVGPGQASSRRAAPRREPGGTSQRQASPEPATPAAAAAGQQHSRQEAPATGRHTSPAQSTATGPEPRRETHGMLQTRFSHR